MGRLGLATILVITQGVGFALVEASVHSRLGWARPVWGPGLDWLAYRIGMLIVLSTPWVLLKRAWAWLYATVLALLSEDAAYWLLIMQYPHPWSLYPVWHGVPLDYLPALALLIASVFILKRRGC